MSTPLSSLKKAHKTPFGSGHSPAGPAGMPSVPFRPGYTDDESKLLEEITGNMASSRIKNQRDPFNGGVPKLPEMSSHGGRPNASRGSNSNSTRTSPRSTTHNPKTSDQELMSLMMARLAELQQRVMFQTKELAEKDKKIRILEDKVKILNKAREGESPGKTQHLEKRCLLLQQQVHEMEQFLADYGMIWVGEQGDDDADVYNDSETSDDNDSKNGENSNHQGIWRPGNSLPSDGLEVNYDQVIHNVKELNMLAGEGVARVQRTVDGARLKMPDSIPLVLYSNGIVLFQGPFRPFTDPSTQQCVQDLMDGYFPTELQTRYPDGVPIEITDKRDVFFKVKQNAVFSGSGQLLGGEEKPSRLIPSNLDKGQSVSSENQEGLREESELPGPKLSVDQFLNRLPLSVVKSGRVIDVRNSLREDLQSVSKPDDVTVVDTDIVKELRKRLEVDSRNRPPTPRDVTTLRIKGETGERTFVLKMKFTDTIGDLRRYLDSYRPSSSPPYDILSTFPSRVLMDNTATLHSSGLTPNATLHLKILKQPGTK